MNGATRASAGSATKRAAYLKADVTERSWTQLRREAEAGSVDWVVNLTERHNKRMRIVHMCVVGEKREVGLNVVRRRRRSNLTWAELATRSSQRTGSLLHYINSRVEWKQKSIEVVDTLWVFLHVMLFVKRPAEPRKCALWQVAAEKATGKNLKFPSEGCNFHFFNDVYSSSCSFLGLNALKGTVQGFWSGAV